MADIRIKDITTTASASLTGDFLPIDGTTGTRKLSAFSPTFGGNATVTGTLTVNSTSPSVFAGRVRSNLSNTSLGDSQLHVQNAAASATNGALSQATFFGQPGYTTFVGTTGDGTTASYQGGVLGSAIRFNEGYVITDAANGLLLHGINGSIRLATGNPGSVKATFDSAGTLSLTATTASTTTSSGALVVSGGVGVAGAIVAGDTITSTTSTNSGVLQLNLVNSSTGTSASSLFRFNAGTRTATLQAYNDTHATLAGQLRVGTSNGDIVLIPSGVTAATFGASAISLGALNYTNTITGGDSGAGTSIAQFKDGVGSTKINFKGNGEVVLSASTASTSTSSGALVVSGGVGVAKRIHSGEGLTTGGDNETQISFVRNGTISIGPTSAATPKLAVGGGLQLSNTSQSISAWGDIGPQLSIAGAVVTDTTSSGTVSRAVANSINATAFAASSSTTYTQAVSLFIADAPTANTNVTITHRYALYTAGGRINFQGLPTSSAGLQAGTLWNDGGTLKVA